MRGSLRKNFRLNSIHRYLQCTSRLQQFLNISISSDFAHIPNLGFLIDSLQWYKPLVDVFFHLQQIGKKTLWTIKKGSNSEQRECKCANTWGGDSGARGQKSLQHHFCCMLFVFITLCFHSALTFLRFNNCNWTEKSQFYCFPERDNFRFILMNKFFSKNSEKYHTSLPSNVVFISEHRCPLSIIVFEKIDFEIRVRIRPKFNFYADVALLC